MQKLEESQRLAEEERRKKAEEQKRRIEEAVAQPLHTADDNALSESGDIRTRKPLLS
jgi:hypothetical protein